MKKAPAKKRSVKIRVGGKLTPSKDSVWAGEEVKPAPEFQPKLTEMFVFGMALGSDQRRPVLILKDTTGQLSLPVWLNPVDASFAIGDHAHEAYAAHSVVMKIMQAFKLKLERCIFNGLKGHSQLVRLEFSGNENFTHLDSRAADAMSLCLAASVRFYAQADVIARSREVDAELLGIEAGLLSKPEIGFRNHKYVM